MRSVLIVGSQHGDELLGEQLYRYLARRPHPQLHVEYVVANPDARQRHVRYIESDMNRSFTGETATHEERCAQKLLAHLAGRHFDLVIDAHTTTVEQAPCIILPGIRPNVAAYLRATHIKNIVVMKYAFVDRSLIGNVPNAVSVEISNSQLGSDLFAKLRLGLIDFATGSGRYPRKTVFEVDGLIDKASTSSEEAKRLRNFQLGMTGYYPILVGENSYKKQTSYLGFKAMAKKRLVLPGKSNNDRKHQL